jgi:peptide/nickel transport system ATP-binding protein
MYLGHLVEIGSAEEVIENPKHPYTKVLKWATPDLDANTGKAESPPVRDIDIPDPVNPPSGCRFHTRCPEAREVCQTECPALDEAVDHDAACFREDPDHEYWESPELTEESFSD